MDFDNLFILLIILSFVARAIGDALKGGKKGQGQGQGQHRAPRPGQRLPGPPPGSQRLPQPRPREASAQRGGQPPVRVEERAAELIPAELWEILTGQPRPAPAPAPRPPQPVHDEADEDEELLADEESLVAPEVSTENRDIEELLRRRREAVSRRERGPEPYRPQVVSLETPPLPTAARHAAFHEKRPAQAPATVLRRGPAPGLARLAGTEAGALRRAIILQEVLGRPKGLE